jgi:hypothetical protein
MPTTRPIPISQAEEIVTPEMGKCKRGSGADGFFAARAAEAADEKGSQKLEKHALPEHEQNRSDPVKNPVVLRRLEKGRPEGAQNEEEVGRDERRVHDDLDREDLE